MALGLRGGSGQQPLRQMCGRLFLKVREELNHTNYYHSLWKDMATILDGEFEMNAMDITKIERARDQAECFLMHLSAQGMTVEQFFQYAAQARLYTIVDLFNYERKPLVFSRQPFHEMNVVDGEPAEFLVEARGFPPPSYQWFSDGHGKIEGATSSRLYFPSVSPSDAGKYFCVASNSPYGSFPVESESAKLVVLRAKPMEIKEQPNSFTVSQGGNASMKCEVWGDGPVLYQWLKDEVELSDGPHISGSQCNELRIYKVDSREWTGCYSCRIQRNDEVLYTVDATLQLSRDGPVKHYTATDKVALLMGAGDYRSDRELTAPEKDVQSLAKIFTSLNFKVVSLYNLTKLEMEAAIDEFKFLVGKGVYCVFYFCGHGFEASNHCFLVPPDAPQGYDYRHCLSADHILFNIFLPRWPRVCCMILDICRKNREGPNKPRIVHKDIQAGSHIVCYGTSQGLAAYEERKHGILVNHLKTILLQDMGIESVFQKLREEISHDPKLQQKNLDDKKKFRQIPEVLTNLWEPDRSFHDPIVYSGHTSAFLTRNAIWEKAHEKPDDREITVPFGDFNVKIRLNFQQEFSNVLKIYLSVIDPGPTFSCQAYISAIPQDVQTKAEAVRIRSGTKMALCQNYVRLYDIQRLKADMTIQIEVNCQMDFGVQERKVIEENLGLPLVSRLQLWRNRRVVMGPTELEEEVDNDEDEN